MQGTVAHRPPQEQIRRLGRRAVVACELHAGAGEWTPRTVLVAARALDEGSRTAGVRRSWPRLAARLKRIGARWLASQMVVRA